MNFHNTGNDRIAVAGAGAGAGAGAIEKERLQRIGKRQYHKRDLAPRATTEGVGAGAEGDDDTTDGVTFFPAAKCDGQ
jgi:hypothetical protein